MIDVEKRKAVYLLHEEGMGVRELSRKLRISRATVRRIIKDKGAPDIFVRSDRKKVDEDLLVKLYDECQGYVERIHEKLKEENGIEIGYSTLTRLVREMGLGKKTARRDERIPDEPGQEMQHDTSPYKLKFDNQLTKVVASSLYLRYSKRRYLKFYPFFNRYIMKSFFFEALTHLEHSAPTCIIDNTNLAVLRGSGKNAVMVPEMIAFGKQYAFDWQAHEIGHSDRKGGVESGFWYIETNFFPGRSFSSFEDLNQQAFEWATQRIALKPHAKTKLIPAQLFEFEKSFLQKLPPYISPPIEEHYRETDQYGYAAFEANYYWVPGEGRGKVRILRFPDKIRMMKGQAVLAEYKLPSWGTKNERFKPKGVPDRRPNNCKKPTGPEENRLKALGPEIQVYLEVIKKLPASSNKKYRLIRQLFRLSLKLQPDLFIKTIKRAQDYGVTDIETIERIAIYQIHDSSHLIDDFEYDFRNYSPYPELDVSDLPDLSQYELKEGDEDE